MLCAWFFPCELPQDGRTFIHITNWTLGRTELQSVTLLSGPCSKQFVAAAAAKRDLPSTLSWDASITGSNTSAGAALLASCSGCNVYTVDNSDVVPALLGAGTVPSSEQLLLLLQSNASLGYHTPGAIMR